MKIKWFCLLGMFCVLYGQNNLSAETISSSSWKNDWTFAVTPYFWFADIGATIQHGSAGGSKETNVKIGTDDYLDNLKMAFPLALEAREGRWFILSDFLYMRLADEKSKVESTEFNSGGLIEVSASLDAGTNTTLEMTGWTVLSGYQWIESNKGSFEPMFGFRYFGTRAETNWNLSAAINGPGPGDTFQKSGNAIDRETLWDILIGFRGKARLGQTPLSIPYYLDLGTGEADFTWQAMAGLTYAFHWGEISATYRQLEYQTSGSSLLQDLRFSGPSVGVSFQF
ncbi:MAG: hypothetical protein IPP35_01430 [Elusimicrobia bacterium]|nr:hypothetical protein [Elusimicrobiota bacterium]